MLLLPLPMSPIKSFKLATGTNLVTISINLNIFAYSWRINGINSLIFTHGAWVLNMQLHVLPILMWKCGATASSMNEKMWQIAQKHQNLLAMLVGGTIHKKQLTHPAIAKSKNRSRRMMLCTQMEKKRRNHDSSSREIQLPDGVACSVLLKRKFSISVRMRKLDACAESLLLLIWILCAFT